MEHGLTTTGPALPGDAPPAPPDTPRYRFEAFLARGGIAEVWRGCDRLLAREVALKVLREPVFGDGGARGREFLHPSQRFARPSFRQGRQCVGEGNGGAAVP